MRYYFTLKMDAAHTLETSVDTNQTMLRHSQKTVIFVVTTVRTSDLRYETRPTTFGVEPLVPNLIEIRLAVTEMKSE
jgi:hypothetical protein